MKRLASVLALAILLSAIVSSTQFISADEGPKFFLEPWVSVDGLNTVHSTATTCGDSAIIGLSLYNLATEQIAVRFPTNGFLYTQHFQGEHLSATTWNVFEEDFTEWRGEIPCHDPKSYSCLTPGEPEWWGVQFSWLTPGVYTWVIEVTDSLGQVFQSRPVVLTVTEPTPSPTPTLTSTPTYTPTLAPSPTNTPVPASMIGSIEVVNNIPVVTININGGSGKGYALSAKKNQTDPIILFGAWYGDQSYSASGKLCDTWPVDDCREMEPGDFFLFQLWQDQVEVDHLTLTVPTPSTPIPTATPTNNPTATATATATVKIVTITGEVFNYLNQSQQIQPGIRIHVINGQGLWLRCFDTPLKTELKDFHTGLKIDSDDWIKNLNAMPISGGFFYFQWNWRYFFEVVEELSYTGHVWAEIRVDTGPDPNNTPTPTQTPTATPTPTATSTPTRTPTQTLFYTLHLPVLMR